MIPVFTGIMSYSINCIHNDSRADNVILEQLTLLELKSAKFEMMMHSNGG